MKLAPARIPATAAPTTAFMGATTPKAAELSPEVPLPAVPLPLAEGAAAEPLPVAEADPEALPDAETFALPEGAV